MFFRIYTSLHLRILKIFQHEHEAKQQPKSPWPHVLKVANADQTIIRFKNYVWLDMENIRETLG